MPFRFGSFGLLSKLEMYKTPLTDCSTVHTVGFRHLETRPVYFRPRSHRVEVAASGDPRTNGDSTFYYFYYYQESKATGRPPLPTNSSLQTLKLQPHASPHLGTDLRIAQLSNIGSFDHHLSTPDCASRQTPEPKIESTAVTILTRAFRKHSREYVEYDLIAPENTNAFASRHKRVSFYLARTGEKKSFYARVPRWSLADETLAARGNTQTNGDSTLKSTIRDAFPLRELRASQQTGDIAPLSTPSASDISRHDRSCLYFDFKNQNAVLELFENAAIRSAILAFHRFEFHRLKQHKSHHVEVAALGDPRSNGDSTLKSTIRDAFPLRELWASQQTGDIAPPSTPSASDISRHDRSCLYIDFKNQNAVLDCRYNLEIDFDVSQVLPTQLEFDREDLGKILKHAAIRSIILVSHKISTYRKYYRPRSHRVEVAASGDPRTNGDSTLYYFYYYQESKATGRPPLPTNSSLQTLKLQPHASPHLGTDLRIAQLSNIGSFDHHLSTTDCASRQTPEPKIESTAVTILTRAFRKHSREYVEYDLIAPENTNAFASRHKRVSFYLARTGEKKSFYARVPRWSLADETLAARGNTRTNGDSTLKSTIRDAFPLRELRASQQTGDIAPLSTPSASDISRHDRSCLYFDFKNQNAVLVETKKRFWKNIKICSHSPSKLFENAAIRSAILAFHRFEFHRLKQHKSHRVEVAALGDPRSNGDSTLKSTIRDAFPFRELRASQQTGDIAPPSTPSASDISRHDRSCLYFDFKNQNAVLDCRYNLEIDFDVSQVLPTQVPPRGEKILENSLKHAAIRSIILVSQKISTNRKHYRPRSHHVEVAASGDPRANGVSTLKSTSRDAFPLRELRASQQTGDNSVFHKYYRPRSHHVEVAASGDPRANGDSTLRFAEREGRKKKMRREESQNVRTREKYGAEKKRKKRISVSCSRPHAPMNIEDHYSRVKPEYENPARFFGTERRRPAQKPTPKGPSQGKKSMYHKYCRPRSHRVEVAASGDPRTNGDSTLYYFYYYQESKATGRPPLPTNSSLQTLKLQPHASPHLGTDLRIAQLSNIGSFDHHLSTTDCASRQTPEPKIESYRIHGYLREYSGNTHASMLKTLEPILDLIAPENTNAYASRLPRWSLADETLAARGNTRTNGDSTLKSTIRDAFPLRELRASQQTGDIAPLSTPSASDISRHDRSCLYFDLKNQSILIYRKYYRPRSHRLEVAASGDPRANGDSTLKFAFEISFCFGSFRPIRKLEMDETLLTKNSTVHSVSFRHLETRPVKFCVGSKTPDSDLGRN
ncbi:hypothetical protein V1477_007929 [Vespula maculifrons]|uniref:Uncharacterized protein n=1 Tax=Vespula maculifrons TaxID=7453 RepID=A0ABD2CG52_VESMC